MWEVIKMNSNKIKRKKNLFTIWLAIVILTFGFLSLHSEMVDAEDTICPICGMSWDGVTTATINEQTYYYCCPTCSLKHVLEHGQGLINAKCNITDEDILVEIAGGRISSLNPTTTVILFNGSYMENRKWFVNESIAEQFKNENSWALNDPMYTVQQTFDIIIKPITTVVCHKCAMTLSVEDALVAIVNNETWWQCCPMCALKDVVPNDDGEIFGKCTTTGENISITIKDGNATLVIPETTVVSLGGTCMTNKLFKNETLALSYNSSRPVFSIQDAIEQKVKSQVEEPDKEGAPGFELMFVILAVALVFLWRKKRV